MRAQPYGRALFIGYCQLIFTFGRGVPLRNGFWMKRHLWKYLLALVLVVAANDLACVLIGPRRQSLVSDADRIALRLALPSDTRHGNSVQMFYDFDSMVQDLISAIDSARHNIDISFFHFDDDEVGNRVAAHLIGRARAGVRIRFLYDGGQLRRLSLHDKMSEAGIEVRKFNPMYVPWLMRNDFSRNHQKIVVIDGSTCYTGGMNIADRYSLGIEGRPWVDLFMRMEGPVSLQLWEIFTESWTYAKGEPSMDTDSHPVVPAPGMVSLDDVEILASGALGDGPCIMERYCELLDAAREYAYFESPYFIPSKSLLEAMKRAAGRGVDVRVVCPDKSDLGYVIELCSDSFVAEALAAGVRIGKYAPGFLHSKMFLTDDMACVGSTNLDSWSLSRNLELTVFVHDASFTDMMVRHFHSDEANVRYLDASEWGRRPVLRRVGERIWRILRRVL